jgi:ribosome-associated translation inhibitor RaiA/cold shock CspA family protein
VEKPLQIAFKELDTSEAMETLIRERVDKLERFHHKIIGCRVSVEAPHRKQGPGKPEMAIAVEIEVPGANTITVKATARPSEARDNPTTLINRAFDAAQRRLKKVSALQRGEVKQHDAEIQAGQVVRLYPSQGHGFIEVRGSPDLYFTRNAVSNDGFDELEVGSLVDLTPATGEGPMGPQASSVRIRTGRRSPD